MAKTINRLSATKVSKTKEPGWYPDGLGLYLQVSKSGSKSFVYRYEINGKERRHGLGGYPAHSLEYARNEAEKCRKLRKQGKDPIEHKNQQAEDEKQKAHARALEASHSKTFRECAKSYIDLHKVTWTNPKNETYWVGSLTNYAYPVIGDLSVQDITIAHILKIIQPLWHDKTPTASKLRQRIENILDWSTVMEYRDGVNPARWRGHLDRVLPAPKKAKKVKHFESLPYKDIPKYFQKLRKSKSKVDKALAFLILTASRNAETRECLWSEIDGDTWTITADRMKTDGLHRVPLSEEALKILDEIKASDFYDEDVLFGGKWQGKSMSDGFFRKAFNDARTKRHPDITIHGFRTAFRTWTAEMTNYPREITEVALSHSVGSETERAYQRGELLDKRRRLMEAWSDYCLNGHIANVVPINKTKTAI